MDKLLEKTSACNGTSPAKGGIVRGRCVALGMQSGAVYASILDFPTANSCARVRSKTATAVET